MKLIERVGVVCLGVLTVIFVLSAQSNFRILAAIALAGILFMFLTTRLRVIGVLYGAAGYAAVIWASLWNAHLLSIGIVPVLKILHSILMVLMLWRQKQKA